MASDQSPISPLSSRMSLTLVVVDDTDNAAHFNRLQICLSGEFRCDKELRTLSLRMREEDMNLETELRLAKMSDPTKTDEDICYFLEGEDKDYFELDKVKAILRPKRRLDRETKSKFELTLFATEHCQCFDEDPAPNDCDKFISKNSSNSEDISRLKIKVVLDDINDNRPYFAKKLYQIGLTSDAEVGQAFLESFVSFFYSF